MTLFLAALTLLLLGHFVADYSWQSDFVAKHKSPRASLAAVPWYFVMAGHAGTHGLVAAVLVAPFPLAAGMALPPVLVIAALTGLLEAVVHFAIDVEKCEGVTGIHQDQALHVACKVLWAAPLLLL